MNKIAEKFRAHSIFVLLLTVVLCFPGFCFAEDLSEWTFNKTISVQENSGDTLIDYQVKLAVDYESGMNSDFSDLRFTDSDGTTMLDYWMEEYLPADSAIVWVKIPSIPANGIKKIYMYYGNPAASSASDGEATFIFFDGFEDGTLDKWNISAGSPTANTLNPRSESYSMSIDDTDDTTYAYEKNGLAKAYTFWYYATAESGICTGGWFYPGRHWDGPYGVYLVTNHLSGGGSACNKLEYCTGPNDECFDLNAPLTPDGWNRFEINDIDWTAHTYDVYLNNGKIGEDLPMCFNCTTPSEMADKKIEFTKNRGGPTVYFDDFFEREYVHIEPTVISENPSIPAPEILVLLAGLIVLAPGLAYFMNRGRN